MTRRRRPWTPPKSTILHFRGDYIHLRDPVCGTVDWHRDYLDLLLAFLDVSVKYGECIGDLYSGRVDLGPVTERLQLKRKLAEIQAYTEALAERPADLMEVWRLTIGLYDRFAWIREYFPEELSAERKAELDVVTEKFKGLRAKLEALEHRELEVG